MAKPTVYIDITAAAVCMMPHNLPERWRWEIAVERVTANPERWAIRHRKYAQDGAVITMCLNKSGTWNYDLMAGSQTGAWIESHRYDDWITARDTARKAAQDVTVNGVRAADLAAKWEADRG